nr:MAG TPA: hypothetical protein [Caudoviricetes sp.]
MISGTYFHICGNISQIYCKTLYQAVKSFQQRSDAK